MATNPVASLPDADAVRDALRTLRVRRSSRRRCAPPTPSMPAACACRRSPGARRTAPSPTPSARISRQRPFLPRAGRGAAGLVDHRARSRSAWASPTPSPGPARPRFSASTRALSGFENDGARDFDIGACAGIDDDAYRTLSPSVAVGAADALLRRRRLLPRRTGAPASSRPCRAPPVARARASSGRCGSTPAACATSGTP